MQPTVRSAGLVQSRCQPFVGEGQGGRSVEELCCVAGVGVVATTTSKNARSPEGQREDGVVVSSAGQQELELERRIKTRSCSDTTEREPA